MGAQSLEQITLETERNKFEEKIIKEAEEHLMYTYYHLGNPTNYLKLFHLDALFTAYSNPYCNVQNFIKKQYKMTHDYLKIENTQMCENFNLCYNKQQ